jgi:hypothetical protein
VVRWQHRRQWVHLLKSERIGKLQSTSNRISTTKGYTAMNWQNQMMTRRDLLSTAINDRFRKIDLLNSEINALKAANAADRVEFDALDRALAPVEPIDPKQISGTSAEELADRLKGMTDERPTGSAPFGAAYGNIPS